MMIRKWWKRGIALVGVLAVLAVVVLSRDGAADERTSNEAANASAAARTINVVVETVEPVAFAEVVRVTGAAQAERDVTVAAEESGVIRAVYVEKGARVAAGQPIAKIDDRVIRAQYEEAQANASLAAETYERQRKLWEEERIGSEITFLQSKYRAETAEAAAKVAAARLDRMVVRAPIAGILDDRTVEVGSMVAPGAPVARVVDVDPIKVIGGVPERYATQVSPGSSVRIYFDVLAQELEGKIGFVSASLEPQSRTIPVEVLVPNPGGRIKPGMVATVAIARRTVADALSVPQEAVVRRETGYGVFVATERNGQWVAEARAVSLGSSEQGRVLITAGLEPGDRVIIVGQKQVAAGDNLNLIERAEAR